MMVILTKNHYQKPKEITWNDMIEKLSYEFDNDDPKFLINPYTLPTFVCHTDYYPKSFLDAFNEVNYSEMHVYCSLGKQAPTFGNHKDTVDVLIVQAFGKILYKIENKEYHLDPGDSLFIPAYVYHEPVIIEPRITLSFSN